MAVKINVDVCIGCGNCVPTCPVEALSMNNDQKAAVKPDVCIDCGACIGDCPVEAISSS